MDDIKPTKSNSKCEIFGALAQRNSHIQHDLRKSNIFCDAIIVLDDGSCIPVHRIILCNASDFFYALFMSPVNVEPKTQFRIKYVQKEIMELVIEYAYTSKCVINEENFARLLATAEYFCCTGLIEQCIKFILQLLNLDNCVSLMFTTRKILHSHNIHRTIRRFLLKHFTEIGARNEDILSVSIEDITELIRDDALNVDREELVWEFCVRWIEHDEQNRFQHIPVLLESIRLGLIDKDYFEQRVIKHSYVQFCPEAQPIVATAHKFMSEIDEIDWVNDRDIDVSLLVPRLPYEVLFAIGGWFDGSASTLFETYDIRADRWIEFKFGDSYGARAYHSAAVIGAKIYCIGGYSGSEYYNKCTVFDTEAKTWTEVAPMHYRRCYVSVCVLDGKIYAIGGHDGHNRLRTAEVYDPETNQWTLLASMANRRSDADCCVVNDNIYVVGGFDGSICLRTCEMYNPQRNEWTFTPEMLNARSGLKCVAYRGLVYAVGGYNGISRLNSCECYRPGTLFWSQIHEMISPRSNFGIETIDDSIYVTGGFDGLSTINKVEYFKPENNAWKSAAGMNHHRSAHAIAKLSDIRNIEDFVYEPRTSLVEREVV